MKPLKQLKKMTLEKRMMYWAKHSKEPLFGIAPEGRSLLEKIDDWGYRADAAVLSWHSMALEKGRGTLEYSACLG